MNRVIASIGSIGLLLAALFAPAANETTCSVSLMLVDAKTGEPVPGLIRIDRANEIIHPPELMSRGVGLPPEDATHQWSVVPTGRAKFTVPADKITITAIAGLETDQAQLKELNLTKTKEVQIEFDGCRLDPDVVRDTRKRTRIARQLVDAKCAHNCRFLLRMTKR